MPQEIRTILGEDYEAFAKERERHGIFTNVPPAVNRLPNPHSNPSANSNDNVKITVDGSSRSSSRLSSPGSHNSSTQAQSATSKD